MRHFFLESSAFAKLFVLEPGSEPLIGLLEHADDSCKLISALASLEIRSAIRRRERAGEIRTVDAARALSALAAECMRIAEQPVSAEVIHTARLILDRHSLRTLDALHLATSMVMRDTLEVADICFVSADGALLKAAEAEQFLILNPLEW